SAMVDAATSSRPVHFTCDRLPLYSFPTRRSSDLSQVLTGKATGYYSCTGRGASGLCLGYGTVAVDPDVIPYGTLLYITSTDGRFVYGYALATDTGIALQDGQILVDLFYETYAESVINGAINVNVYVVG